MSSSATRSAACSLLKPRWTRNARRAVAVQLGDVPAVEFGTTPSRLRELLRQPVGDPPARRATNAD